MAMRENLNVFSSKATNNDITAECQCDPRCLLVHNHTHLMVWASALAPAFGSCGEPVELLSQNGNGFSGVAAGLFVVLLIITGNCSEIAKMGERKDAEGVKRCRAC